MPWDAPASGPRAGRPHAHAGAALRSHAHGASRRRRTRALRTRTPGAPSDRTPAERAFSSDLPSDKSLDEVILEYLSDDAE